MNPIEKTIIHCLQDHYGLDGHLQRLSGENLNYLLTDQNGCRHVIKIVDDDMPPLVTEMEFAAMEYAKSAGLDLDLPIIYKNKYGKLETRIVLHINSVNRLRVLTFIDGYTLEDITDISDKLIKNMGFTLATFHQTLKGFDHPAAHRNHRWNLVRADQHKSKIDLLNDPQKQALLGWGFDCWEEIKGTLDSLPYQFIHGDANPENLIGKSDRVTGLVDFGDACFNPTVCDLAIALAYPMMDADDPMLAMELFLTGYQEVRELNETEQRVLLPLVVGRLATSIAISTARRSIDPDNPNWFGGENAAWALLEFLRERPETRPLTPP